MESIAMDASSPGNDRERSRAFCRELHTIKGAAASVGHEARAGFMHEVEEWLEHTVISGKQSLNGDLLLAAVDSVRQQIAVLEGSGESAAAPEGLSDKPARNLAPIAATPSTRASGGSAGDQSVRVRAQQLDRLMDMLAELVAMRNRREVSSGDMKRLGEELGRCANRLRKFGEESLSLSHGIHDHKSVSGEREYLLLSSEPTGKNSLDEVATDIATITRELNEKFRPLADENAALTGFIRHFRQELMQLRRLPVSGLFQRLKRAIHDAARLENKQVDIRLEGEDTGLEQAMQERLFEPLLHMVRNSVSHGIETPEIRKSSRKPAGGTVTLSAHASASMLTIVVADDGRGLDYDALRRRGFERGLLTPGTNPGERQLAKLIFHPGFSTRETASQVSGRGVGMDVVATTIDRLQGRIEVDSKPNAGMSIRISIPLTTGIEHVMVYRAGGQLFALPMRSIEAANKMASSEVTMVNFSLALAIHGNPGMPGGTESLLLDPELGIQVDEVVGPEEAVVRPLPEILRRHPLVSGVVLSAQGEIVLLLNAERTREWCLKNAEQSSVAPEPESDDKGPEHVAGESERQKRRALVVDDSLSARMAMKRKLAQRDFEVAEAGDGLAALACMRATHFDLVVTDLDMPRMGGLELLGEIARGNFLETTIVVSSSRAKSDVWQRVHEQGAHGYLSKPVSSEALDEVLRATGSMA
jgi:chemotaxis protein histidine kinase CheA